MDPPEELQRLNKPEHDEKHFPVLHYNPGAEAIRLDVPNIIVHNYMTETSSMMSLTQLREKIREKRKKFRSWFYKISSKSCCSLIPCVDLPNDGKHE